MGHEAGCFEKNYPEFLHKDVPVNIIIKLEGTNPDNPFYILLSFIFPSDILILVKPSVRANFNSYFRLGGEGVGWDGAPGGREGWCRVLAKIFDEI